MGPEFSFSCSQGTATENYPESNEVSPHPQTIFRNHFNIIIASTHSPHKWFIYFRFMSSKR